jgi:hypothetical protein
MTTASAAARTIATICFWSAICIIVRLIWDAHALWFVLAAFLSIEALAIWTREAKKEP